MRISIPTARRPLPAQTTTQPPTGRVTTSPPAARRPPPAQATTQPSTGRVTTSPTGRVTTFAPLPHQFTQRVRVRREWRDLRDDELAAVEDGFQKMNHISTEDGRKKFGPDFWNAADLVVFHVCAVVDPRGDQARGWRRDRMHSCWRSGRPLPGPPFPSSRFPRSGRLSFHSPAPRQAHFGPQFMTFHRAFVLTIEKSLLAANTSITAMPYWNPALDAFPFGKYNPDNKENTEEDRAKYIFTDKYIGAYYGTGINDGRNGTQSNDGEENFAVIDGIFKNWNMPSWTEDRYGNGSYIQRFGPGGGPTKVGDETLSIESQCLKWGFFRPAQPGADRKFQKEGEPNPFHEHDYEQPSDSAITASFIGRATQQVLYQGEYVPPHPEIQADLIAQARAEASYNFLENASTYNNDINRWTYRPFFNHIGQQGLDIPEYCTEECRQNSLKCPIWGRLDRYSCIGLVQRAPNASTYSSFGAQGTNDIVYTQEDFNACINADHASTWMEWQNCIEKGIDGLCEIAAPDQERYFEGRRDNLTTQFPTRKFVDPKPELTLTNQLKKDIVRILKGSDAYFNGGETPEGFERMDAETRGFLHKPVNYMDGDGGLQANDSFKQMFTGMINQYWCVHPRGFYDDKRGRHHVNNLHAQMHIRTGADMFDTGTSASDMGVFAGHHNNVDRSNMLWATSMFEKKGLYDLKYPTTNQQTSQDPNVEPEWAEISGEIPYGTSGPFATYHMTYNYGTAMLYRYGLQGLHFEQLIKHTAGNHIRQAFDADGKPWKSYGVPFAPNASESVFDGFRHESAFFQPWLDGTLLDDVVSKSMPFLNLFDDETPEDKIRIYRQCGYTHKDILENTRLDTTPYIFPEMAHLYPNQICDGHQKRGESCVRK